jgi:hypothetical protein
VDSDATLCTENCLHFSMLSCACCRQNRHPKSSIACLNNTQKISTAEQTETQREVRRRTLHAYVAQTDSLELQFGLRKQEMHAEYRWANNLEKCHIEDQRRWENIIKRCVNEIHVKFV